MKLIYIASPLRGDYEENIQKAVEYCKIASSFGVIPLAPHLIFSQWCNDTIPAQREQGLELGLELLQNCDELWVMGETISEGMRGELFYAQENGITTHHIKDPKNLESYPMSADENSLLGSFDVLHDDVIQDYEKQMVILKHNQLKEEYRIPINQLWIATHGPGCRTNYTHSDTVHLVHPIDKDRMTVARSDILGLAKPEVVGAIYETYHINEILEEADELDSIDEDMSL